jgi:hypothetical protein
VNAPDRKPLAESTEPWTIRVKPSVRTWIEAHARDLGLDPAEYGRDCLVMGDSVLRSLSDGKAYIRVLA